MGYETFKKMRDNVVEKRCTGCEIAEYLCKIEYPVEEK
jgi:hypothetical protein